MHDSLKPILLELDRPGSHIVYNTLTKTASLCSHSLAGNVAISHSDLLVLFEKSWIARYDTIDGEHRYHITDIGRKAAYSPR